jgi:manganese/zinc/iron transport system substrate-binding protein
VLRAIAGCKELVDAVQMHGMQVRLGDELYADALGDAASEADTYVKMVQHNVRAIVEGLRVSHVQQGKCFATCVYNLLTKVPDE